MKILIIEDVKELSESIVGYLSDQNFLCETAFNLDSAKYKIGLYDYDCILLDIALPDGNGLDLLKEIKSEQKKPGVIVISAKNALDDRITGLQLGADDYLTKPFHLAELSARIMAVIRRMNFNGNNVLTFRELKIDLKGKSVHVGEKEVPLSRKETDLLFFLIANKNRVISKNAIAEHLSGEDADMFDSFDFIYAHIKNLKKKLNDAGCNDYIKTIYGVGYKFLADEAA